MAPEERILGESTGDREVPLFRMECPVADSISVGSGLSEVSEEVTVLVVAEEEVDIDVAEIVEEDVDARTRLTGFP